ncbi:hypothetical protein [Streptomyces alkaliphilus]|uniref:hypothetical protein n=1 Tax=Streptomyces alkaliphilus TaxID=1472722 RepID=UPI001180AB79|nr:hypothetical protein [Streptomyces alkaliphilus]MQS08139.1 hypothetical protein [Streptomyces alkaliphilus]
MSSSRRSVRRSYQALCMWRFPQWATACGAAAGTALLIGLPTAVVPNPVFGRSIPVQWWNYPALALSAVAAGLVLATYLRVPGDMRVPERASRLGVAGGLLSFLAVGCPVCNKLVLVLLGTSGALAYWAPLQPLVALGSLVLLVEAALRRLSLQADCPLPTTK